MTSSSAKSSLCVEFYLLCTFVDNCCERGKKGRWMAWGEIVPSSNPQPSTQRTLSFHPRNAYLTIKQKKMKSEKEKLWCKGSASQINQSQTRKENHKLKKNEIQAKSNWKNSLPTTLVFRFFVITMTSNQSSLSRQSSSGKSISF